MIREDIVRKAEELDMRTTEMRESATRIVRSHDYSLRSSDLADI